MTEYVKTVDPNGSADYSSLNLWEDGEDDLYQSGDVAIADCRRNGSAKDTTAVNVNGWTTGVEARVVVNPAYRHEGKWADQRGDGEYAYVIESSSTHPVYCTSNDVNLFGLLVRNDGGGYSNGVQLVGQRCTLNESIVQVTAKSAGHRGVYVNSANGGVRNVIVYSLHASPSQWAYQKDGGVGWAYNCGAYNMGFGFRRGGTIDWDVTNCWALKCNDPYTDTSGIHGDHNVSSGSYAPGTTVAVNKTSYTDYFVDPANGDFHLKAPAQQLWGISGQNLSALFTTDIDGQTRSAWDIGADEYVTETGHEYTETLSLSVSADFAISSFLSGSSSVTLAASAQHTPTPGVQLPVVVSMPTYADVLTSHELRHLAALALESRVTVTQEGSTDKEQVLSLGVTAGTDQSANVSGSSSVTLAAHAAFSPSVIHGLLETAQLHATAGLTPTGSLLITLTEALIVQSSMTQDGYIGARIYDESITLGARAAVDQALSRLVDGTLGLGVSANLDIAEEQVLASQVALQINADIKTLSTLAAQALVAMGINAEAAPAITSAFDASLTLGIEAILQQAATVRPPFINARFVYRVLAERRIVSVEPENRIIKVLPENRIVKVKR